MGDELNETFEAIIFDWDGTAVPDRASSGAAVRSRLHALTAVGVHLGIVSGTNVANVNGQLAARPPGPGSLHLCVNRGSEVYELTEPGASLILRRVSTPDEERALDEAAAVLAGELAAAGLAVRVISDRLNRRKIDLIPEPAWAAPPKSQLGALLAAVSRRLEAAAVGTLEQLVRRAEVAARGCGLDNPCVTTDAKHLEIGLTSKADSTRWLLAEFARMGIGPGLVLVVGDEFGDLGGTPGSDLWMSRPAGDRARVVSVGPEPNGVPINVDHLGGGPGRFLALLDEQIRRRSERRVPGVDVDASWTVAFDGGVPEQRRVRESLLCLADGVIGTRGVREESETGATALVVAAGVYDDRDPPGLLAGPTWTNLDVDCDCQETDRAADRRVLDLRTGVLWRSAPLPDGGRFRSLRFASATMPGVVALRAEGSCSHVRAGTALRADGPNVVSQDPVDDTDGVSWAAVCATNGGGIGAAAVQRSETTSEVSTVERLACYVGDPDGCPDRQRCTEDVVGADSVGFDQVLAAHRRAWATRWDQVSVTIEGDPDAEIGVRFAIFHLLSSVGIAPEAAVGARGLSGAAYLGHVFWDADVFVLPAMVALNPAAARAMLRYRLHRLPAALADASADGLRGARFPWESAHDGHDVTPTVARGLNGQPIAIRTGELECHIVADVAWAANHDATWSGDPTWLAGDGQPLLFETARYWASRIEVDPDGSGHLRGVIGPDEYHEQVDDNAFTNIMARWNLRRAAKLLPESAERDEWLASASSLVDGLDTDSGVYEQFRGYDDLEPLRIAEVATPPVAADLLLGHDRLERTQVIKQADVLMAHHLVPDDVAPGSLQPNLDRYLPFTAHGSSLSPAIHASLLARAGRADEALGLFRMACRLDLDDLTGSTAGGLHLATMGGVWQALAFGFLGLAVQAGRLSLAPSLPAAWSAVELRCFVLGNAVRVEARHDEVSVQADPGLSVAIGNTVRFVGGTASTFRRKGDNWRTT